MDAHQFKKSLMTLHWSTLTLADILHCPTDVVMGWYFGYDVMPSAVADWLERLTKAHESNPPPVGGVADHNLGVPDAGND